MMKRSMLCLAVLVCSVFGLCAVVDDERIWMRGDANADGAVNGSDASYILNWLYQGGSPPPCKNQADVNNDGSITQSDAVYLLNYLYNGGPVPPYPGASGVGQCVSDDYPRPGCVTLSCP